MYFLNSTRLRVQETWTWKYFSSVDLLDTKTDKSTKPKKEYAFSEKPN